jgi:transcriptional regulator with XRE-family HTH domain
MDKFERLHLREWRMHKGYTGTQLGNLTGITKSEISRLENGSRRITMNHAKRLADALKIQPEDLTVIPGTALINAKHVHLPKREAHGSRVSLGGVPIYTEPPFRLIPTSSDEMRPTISPGDYVVVNTSISTLNSNGLYLIDIDGQEAVRRVQIVGGTIRLTCDNTLYAAEERQANKIELLGQVVGLLTSI